MDFLKRLFGKQDVDIVEGGIYITRNNKRSYPYSACKILHEDEQGVAIMMYRNCFKEVPTDLDLSTLTVAMPTTEEEAKKLTDEDSDMRIGVGCVPIDREGFLAGNPVLIAKTNVEDWERYFYNSMLESMGESRTWFKS